MAASVPGAGATTVVLNRGRVAEWFRSRLYRPGTTAILPWLIHQAYIGNWNPIAEGILSDSRNADSALNFRLVFSHYMQRGRRILAGGSHCAGNQKHVLRRLSYPPTASSL